MNLTSLHQHHLQYSVNKVTQKLNFGVSTSLSSYNVCGSGQEPTLE
jgi:hypothetical protein